MGVLLAKPTGKDQKSGAAGSEKSEAADRRFALFMERGRNANVARHGSVCRLVVGVERDVEFSRTVVGDFNHLRLLPEFFVNRRNFVHSCRHL